MVRYAAEASHLRRRLFNLMVAGSLALCLASSAAFVGSYFRAMGAYDRQSMREEVCTASRGVFSFTLHRALTPDAAHPYPLGFDAFADQPTIDLSDRLRRAGGTAWAGFGILSRTTRFGTGS